MTLEDLVVVDLDGNVVEGTRSPTTEKDLHLSALRAYPELGAVIHTHAVYATMFALAHEPIPAVIEEVVVYIGGDVPCCEYKGTGSKALGDEVAAHLADRGAALLANHGLVTCASTPGEGAAQRRPRRAHRQDRVGRAGDGGDHPPAAGEGEHRHGGRLPLPPRQPLTAPSGVEQGHWCSARGTRGIRVKKPIGVALLLLAGLVVAACGTRLNDQQFAEASGTGATQQSATGATTGGTGTGDTTGGTTTGGTTTGAPRPAATGGTATGGTTTGGTTRRHHRRATTGGTTGGATAASGPNQASDIGITANPIVIGNITAENGVLGDAFAPAARGMRAWAAATNAAGGINGRQIVLKTCDDGEVRSRTLACAQQLVEQDHAFAIVGANTRAMGGAAQYLNDKGIPVIGFPITNSYYRYPHFWSVYPSGYARDGVTVGYKGQLVGNTVIYRWFKQNLKVTKAAVFEYDIAESQQAGEEFAQGLRLEGYQVDVYKVSFAGPELRPARGHDAVAGHADHLRRHGRRRQPQAVRRDGPPPVLGEGQGVHPVSMGDAVGHDLQRHLPQQRLHPGLLLRLRRHERPRHQGLPRRLRQATSRASRCTSGRSRRGPRARWWRRGSPRWAPPPPARASRTSSIARTSTRPTASSSGSTGMLRDYAAPTGPYCTTIAHWQDSDEGLGRRDRQHRLLHQRRQAVLRDRAGAGELTGAEPGLSSRRPDRSAATTFPLAVPRHLELCTLPAACSSSSAVPDGDSAGVPVEKRSASPLRRGVRSRVVRWQPALPDLAPMVRFFCSRASGHPERRCGPWPATCTDATSRPRSLHSAST